MTTTKTKLTAAQTAAARVATAARVSALTEGIVSPARRAFLARAVSAHCAAVLSAAEATCNAAEEEYRVALGAYARARTAAATATAAADAAL